MGVLPRSHRGGGGEGVTCSLPPNQLRGVGKGQGRYANAGVLLGPQFQNLPPLSIHFLFSGKKDFVKKCLPNMIFFKREEVGFRDTHCGSSARGSQLPKVIYVILIYH